MQRCWLPDGGYLTEGKGVGRCPFYNLLLLNKTMRLAGTLRTEGWTPILTMTWPLQFKINLSSRFLGTCQQCGFRARCAGGRPIFQTMWYYKKILGRELPPGSILSLLQTLKCMLYFLFFLKSFDIWSLILACGGSVYYINPPRVYIFSSPVYVCRRNPGIYIFSILFCCCAALSELWPRIYAGESTFQKCKII